VICMSEEVIPYNRKCYLVPISIIWDCVSFL
jgi:hypothetical protein